MKKIIIIGSGIAGLSAGCYARMNGYEAEIFEKHTLPGGLCTGWKRGGYTFDGCIHWLVGTTAQSPFHKYWNELGALDGKTIVNHEIFTTLEVGSRDDRKVFSVYSDADKLNAHMKELGPEDSEEIDRLTALIKKFADFGMGGDKPAELMGIRDYLGMMKAMKPFYKEFKEYGKLSIGDYARRYKNPYLRQGIAGILDMPDFSFFALVMVLSWQNTHCAGYPVGGSLEFSRGIEKKFLKLGGKIHYSSPVKSIMVRNGRAYGIKLENGDEYASDIVVSAADGYATIYKMLSGKFVNGKVNGYYRDLPIFEPFFFLSLGVKRDLSSEPQIVVRFLDKPMILEGKTYEKIGYKHYCYDSTLAPKGKSVVEILYTSSYAYWAALKDNPEAYKAEKERVTKTLIEGFEQCIPGISGDIEVIDAATPLTFERYTGNRFGSYEGWKLTPKNMMLQMKKTLPGLSNFYMIGQWVQPGGGLPSALKTGRDLVYLLCHKDGKSFKA